ncbi:uncharacterized protein TNCV_2314771 [Trichonephila clavipes]|nr:uncharacterized protein TNCV_2314771 [Trichonephila clavipes]
MCRLSRYRIYLNPSRTTFPDVNATENHVHLRIEGKTFVGLREIVRVQYFVRGGFFGHRSRASSKHLSSHLPVDGVRFLGGQKGVALQLQDARVGVGSNKDADHSRCSEK